MKFINITTLSLFLLFTPIYVFAADYTTCFTPGDNCTQLIVNRINDAKEDIKVQAYAFTSKPIVSALIKAHRRGVDVLVLLDKSNVSSQYSVTNTLQNHNIPFLIDAEPKIAHNKVMIIDHHLVITGSFNLTKSAQMSNAENIIIINDKRIAMEYLTNFAKRAERSESLNHYCQHYKNCQKEHYYK